MKGSNGSLADARRSPLPGWNRTYGSYARRRARNGPATPQFFISVQGSTGTPCARACRVSWCVGWPSRRPRPADELPCHRLRPRSVAREDKHRSSRPAGRAQRTARRRDNDLAPRWRKCDSIVQPRIPCFPSRKRDVRSQTWSGVWSNRRGARKCLHVTTKRCRCAVLGLQTC